MGDASELIFHLHRAELAVDGVLEGFASVAGAAVVELEHAEAGLGEQLQGKWRGFPAHALDAWAAVDEHHYGVALAGEVGGGFGEAVAKVLLVAETKRHLVANWQAVY